MTSARVAVHSLAARPARTSLAGIALAAALLAVLLGTAPASAAPKPGAAAAPETSIVRAWDVLPEFPQRLTAWLYDTQRSLAL